MFCFSFTNLEIMKEQPSKCTLSFSNQDNPIFAVYNVFALNSKPSSNLLINIDISSGLITKQPRLVTKN